MGRLYREDYTEKIVLGRLYWDDCTLGRLYLRDCTIGETVHWKDSTLAENYWEDNWETVLKIVRGGLYGKNCTLGGTYTWRTVLGRQ